MEPASLSPISPSAGEPPAAGGPVARIVERVLAVARATPAGRAALVAITGIDGSGKGYVAARVVAELERRGVRTALIGADGWLNLPAVRFLTDDPPRGFYRWALRFDALFRDLLLPLRSQRSLRLVADHAEETATAFHSHTYEFTDVDVIVVEGIFLLKRELRAHYDCSVWLDCSFETALERALARAQEGLAPAETDQAYRALYFPAQELHLALDDPRSAASLVIANDPRLAAPGAK